MNVRGKIAVITGAGSGIGRATALRFAREGASGIVLADRNAESLVSVAAETGGMAVACDVSKESDIKRLASEAIARFGRIDIFFSNAGVVAGGGIDAPDEEWEREWKIHVMAHVWAARAVIEPMAQRGEGYFLITASAAGLLNIVESAPYGVTKHGAVATAEWLAIAYGRRGVRVSCLCPQAVHTGMYQGQGSAGVDGALSADTVAGKIVEAMASEKFLILPHPEVLDYMRKKTSDYDRWIGGMQKIFLRQQEGS